MALSVIRSAIATAIRAVPDVGVVNDFEPHLTREEDRDTYFKDPTLGYLQGWSITREATVSPDASATMFSDGMRSESAHLMVARGYRAFDNKGQTQGEFEDIIEAVRSAMRVQIGTRYGGVVAKAGQPQVRVFEPREFFGVLVHYVEITQVCHEFLP